MVRYRLSVISYQLSVFGRQELITEN